MKRFTIYLLCAAAGVVIALIVKYLIEILT